MLSTRFGVEIEFTGTTRRKAAEAVAKVVGGTVEHIGTGYDTYAVDAAGRRWKIMRDASIRCEKKENGSVVSASDLHSCELVSPILSYKDDIELLQEVVRALRKVGGFANKSCGIHIHLDGKGHTVRTLRNFMGLVHSRQDLIYRALAFNENRMRYCRKVEDVLMARIKEKNPQTMEELENLWYEGYWGDQKPALP